MATRWALLVLSCTASCTALDGTELQRAQARLSAPAEVDLGEADPGVARTTSVTLANLGDAPLHVTARVSPADAPFTLERERVTVAPGTTLDLPLSFLEVQPDTSFQAVLELEHDGEPSADGSTRQPVLLRARTRSLPSCEDANPCTLDQPDPQDPTACLHLPRLGPCDDGNACTTGEQCLDGRCVGTLVNCDDGVACTADTCDGQGGCLHTPTHSWCNDGDPCSTDLCDPAAPEAVAGCVHSVALNGTPCGPMSCAALPLCMEGQCTTVPAPDGFPCEDGNACTLGDQCRSGACLPGAGSGVSAGMPVLVRDAWAGAVPANPDSGEAQPRDDTTVVEAPLNGQWPVRLDGVALAGTLEAPRVLLAWRGATASYGETCYYDPASCSGAPSGGYPSPLALNFTTASLDGQALEHRTLPLASLYNQGSADAWGCQEIPAGGVAAVATVAQGASLAGAALVRFGVACQGFRAAGTMAQQVPERTQVAVFTASVDQLAVQDVVTLTAPPGPSGILTGRDGLPMLAVASANSEFAVGWLEPGPPQPCPACDALDCLCPVSLALRVRRYRTDAHSLALAQEVVQPFSMTGAAATTPVQASDLALSLEGGNLRATWLAPGDDLTQPLAQCDPGPLSGLPQTRNRFDGYSLLVTPVLEPLAPLAVAPWVNALGVVRDALGPVQLEWSRAGSGDAWCEPLDVVLARRGHDGPPEELLRRPGSAGVMVGSAQVQTLDAQAFLTAGQLDGSVLVLAPAMDQFAAVSMELRWPAGGGDVRAHAGQAPRLASGAGTRVLGTLAELGALSRNAMPTPALALFPLGCLGP